MEMPRHQEQDMTSHETITKINKIVDASIKFY